MMLGAVFRVFVPVIVRNVALRVRRDLSHLQRCSKTCLAAPIRRETAAAFLTWNSQQFFRRGKIYIQAFKLFLI